MSPLTETIFAAQILSTLALFGLIWLVQIVHYPLFLRLAPATFAAHEAEHATRTGYVAAPLMLAELVSSLLLLNPHLRPPQISSTQAILGATLVAILWASTFFLQIPLHNRLHRGYDRHTIQRLITTNWLRTAAWTARAALALHWILNLCFVPGGPR